MAANLTKRLSSDASLVEILREQSERHQEKIAFRYLGSERGEAAEVGYDALYRHASAIAASVGQSADRGDHVLLLYPPGLDFIPAFFGCLAAGMVAVPLALPRPRAVASGRLSFLVRDARPAAVLSTSQVREQLSQRFADVADLRNINWISTDNMSDDDGQGNDPVDCRLSDAALLQYTSGSTTDPKPVRLTHGNLVHNLQAIHERFGTYAEGHGVCWLPLYHDMGLIGGVLQTVYCGGSSTLLSPVRFLQQPLDWLQAISETGAIVSGGPNFGYDHCVRKITPAQRANLDLSRWEVAYTGAEPIRAETLDAFAEAFAPCGFRREAFYPCYGLAEATLMVTGGRKDEAPTLRTVSRRSLSAGRVGAATPDDKDHRVLVGCGTSLNDQTLRIVDPATCQQRADNEVGEIWVRGPSVASGYGNRPAEARRSFQGYLRGSGEGPFLRTGDLGFLDAGELFVTGRLKDVIIVRGQNHYPQDVEWVASRADDSLAVDACAAFGVEEDGEPRVVVVQELRRGAVNGQAAALLETIRRSVAVEQEIEVHAVALVKPGGVPRTSSGKTRRVQCRALYLSGELPIVAEWKASRSVPAAFPARRLNGTPPTPQMCADWLQRRIGAALGTEANDIPLDLEFVHLGLSSVQAVSITEDLEAWLHRPVSPTMIYSYPTIQQLADRLAAEPAADQNGSGAADAKPDEQLRAEVAAMSDEQIARLIDQQISHQGDN